LKRKTGGRFEFSRTGEEDPENLAEDPLFDHECYCDLEGQPCHYRHECDYQLHMCSPTFDWEKCKPTAQMHVAENTLLM